MPASFKLLKTSHSSSECFYGRKARIFNMAGQKIRSLSLHPKKTQTWKHHGRIMFDMIKSDVKLLRACTPKLKSKKPIKLASFKKRQDDDVFNNSNEALVSRIDDTVELKIDASSLSLSPSQGSSSTSNNDDSSSSSLSSSIALFRRSEIEFGKLLGTGNFCHVYEVSGITLRKSSSFALIQRPKKKDRIRYAKRDDCRNGGAIFAIKYLRKSLALKDDNLFVNAAADLALEAKILSSLDHDNIIKVHGLAMGGTSAFGTGIHDDYFIMIDRLSETLDQRIIHWKTEEMETQHHNHHNNDDSMIITKTNYALQIANALAYMHERRIIFRDLKPQNIGFKGNHDNSVIKIFDFGLCRQLPRARRDDDSIATNNDDEDETFLLSVTGTRRYMASEIFVTQRYNLKADVYSWAMVFYEMLALKKPFDSYNAAAHQKLVCQRGERPKLSDLGICQNLQAILVNSWSQHLSQRPTMSDVCTQLEFFLF